MRAFSSPLHSYTLARQHPHQISRFEATSTSQILSQLKSPYHKVKSRLHIKHKKHKTRSRGDEVDVCQSKRRVHARSCQSNGAFTLLSLAQHADCPTFSLIFHPSLLSLSSSCLSFLTPQLLVVARPFVVHRP